MPIKDKDYLKTRFENGDNPSQDDFIDLIDSFMHVSSFVADDGGYDVTVWDGNTDAPTKNSVRDKIVLMDADIAGKAATVHTHIAADITDFNTAADARITVQKGATDGLATLDSSSKIPVAQLPISAGTGVNISSGVIALDTNATKRSLGLVIDGGGSVLTTGVKGDIIVPANMTVTGWTLIADQVGSAVIDVWRDSYANYPATVTGTIAGSEKPTLSSVNKNQNNSLSTWTTSLTEGDIIRFNVDSVSTVTRITLIINTVIV